MTASTAVSTQFVYAIRSPRIGLIKIGISADPRRRLRALDTAGGERLELLGFSPGDRATELELHGRFREFRSRGEWFSPDPALLAWVDTLDRPFRSRKESPIAAGLRDGSLALSEALQLLLELAIRLGGEQLHEDMSGALGYYQEREWPGWPVLPLDVDVEYEEARHAFLAAWRAAQATP